MKKILLLLFLLIIPVISSAESACFVAIAYNDYGESGYSEPACCDMEVGQTATLTFNPVAGAIGYKIYYRPPWIDTYNTSKMVDLGNVTTAQILAVDVFKLSSGPVLIINCEN